MKRAHPEVEYRLNILQGMMYAACGLGAWCFNDQKHLYMSTAAHHEELQMLLRAGGCLDAAIARKDEEGIPCIYSGEAGLGWIYEWVHLQNGGQILVILGPFYIYGHSVDESLHRLDRKGISLSARQQYLSILGDVPVLQHEMMEQYANMLHFICYDENLSRSALHYETAAQDAPADSVRDASSETEAKTPANDYLRMVEHEKMLLKCLAEGVVPGESENRYTGEMLDFKLKNPLRQVQDNLIIFTGVCARKAIESGVLAQTGKRLESKWVRRIEEMQTFGDASRIVNEMYGVFQTEVKKTREQAGYTKAVRECRDYVRLNYTKPLTAEEIARHCGYTEYYLTRKFAKETGIKLTDYIRSVRLDAAKVMLLTSKKDIQQIGEELQFGSRSYFDRVFTREVGVSPKRYRDTMGMGRSV